MLNGLERVTQAFKVDWTLPLRIRALQSHRVVKLTWLPHYRHERTVQSQYSAFREVLREIEEKGNACFPPLPLPLSLSLDTLR